MTTKTIPIDIPVQPWYPDHVFAGRTILPAVESMMLLAAAIQRMHPEVDIRIMEDIRFAGFLEIPEQSTHLPALVEANCDDNGMLRAFLLSRIKLKSMKRLRKHAEILFPSVSASSNCDIDMTTDSPAGSVTEIAAEDIYRELVPFGPAYRTLQGSLVLSGKKAWGRLKAPLLNERKYRLQDIGSPFPLDGAFHAACVLGQCYADFIPFPVGVARRIIHKPTRPGTDYLTRVELISRNRDELIFNLSIFDAEGKIYEIIKELRMRDVSGGKMKPPAWLAKKIGSK